MHSLGRDGRVQRVEIIGVLRRLSRPMTRLPLWALSWVCCGGHRSAARGEEVHRCPLSCRAAAHRPTSAGVCRLFESKHLRWAHALPVSLRLACAAGYSPSKNPLTCHGAEAVRVRVIRSSC